MTRESINSTTSEFVLFTYWRSNGEEHEKLLRNANKTLKEPTETRNVCRNTFLPVVWTTASSAVTLGVATVSSLLMGLAPWVRREQMANSQQIVSVHAEHLRLVCKEKEKQKGRLAASRDSKRDATANPIRKTQLNQPLPGHSHADWLWQKPLMGQAYK